MSKELKAYEYSCDNSKGNYSGTILLFDKKDIEQELLKRHKGLNLLVSRCIEVDKSSVYMSDLTVEDIFKILEYKLNRNQTSTLIGFGAGSTKIDSIY